MLHIYSFAGLKKPCASSSFNISSKLWSHTANMKYGNHKMTKITNSNHNEIKVFLLFHNFLCQKLISLLKGYSLLEVHNYGYCEVRCANLSTTQTCSLSITDKNCFPTIFLHYQMVFFEW